MENVKFHDVIKSYENKCEDVTYDYVEKTEEDRRLLHNDLNRLVFLSIDRSNKVKIACLKVTTYAVMSTIATQYVQGMHEIASVFIYYYFSKEFDNYYEKCEKQEQEDKNLDFVDLIKNNEFMKNWNNAMKNKVETVRVVLTNVFTRKYDPLVKDSFKTYITYMKVCRCMLRKRGITISETEIHKYMGSILTFFLRDVKSYEDAYKIFEIVLSCPPSSLFPLLIMYYDHISKGNKIPEIDSNTYQSLILLEDEFLRTLEEMKTKKKNFFSRNAVFIGGVVGFALAVAFYKMNKRNEQ